MTELFSGTAASATSITMGFKRIYHQQLGMFAASIFLIVLLSSYSTNDPSNLLLSAEAQSSITNIQGADNDEAIDTFHVDGAIGSLVTDLLNSTERENVEEEGDSIPIYVLAGNWTLDVINGEASYFEVDFIMGLQNGTQMQTYSVTNLRNIVIIPSSSSSEEEAGLTSGQESSDNLVLNSANNYSLSLFGYVDVLANDTVIWKNVPISIDIFNGNTISIVLDSPSTDNRFKGQPIYGIVTSILDSNDKPIKPPIWAAAATA